MTSFFAVLLVLALRQTPIFTSPRWIWFGAVSYPLYLIHQNVGYMLFNVIGSAIDRDVLFWMVIAAAIGFSLLLHVGVEKPVAGPLKRKLACWLEAVQSYGAALRRRARQ